MQVTISPGSLPILKMLPGYGDFDPAAEVFCCLKPGTGSGQAMLEPNSGEAESFHLPMDAIGKMATTSKHDLTGTSMVHEHKCANCAALS